MAGEDLIEANVFDPGDDWLIRYRLGENELIVDFQITDTSDGDECIEYSGSIKWDGCMNWETSPACMLHFCEAAEIDLMKVKFEKAWELAYSIMPKALVWENRA